MAGTASRHYHFLFRCSRSAHILATAIILSAHLDFLCLHQQANEHLHGLVPRESSARVCGSSTLLFADARVKRRSIEGDLWRDGMEAEQAANYYWFKMKSPIHFYGRTCGTKVKGARLIVAKVAEWSLNEILEQDIVPHFLLHVRFLLETYGWRIAPDPENEQRCIVVMDFENIALTTLLTNWYGMFRLFRLARPTVKAASLSWSKVCLLNAPYLLQKLISLGKTMTRFRAHDIIIPQSAEETTEAIRDFVGEQCLPMSYGGRNALPPDESDVEQAVRHFVLETLAAKERPPSPA